MIREGKLTDIAARAMVTTPHSHSTPLGSKLQGLRSQTSAGLGLTRHPCVLPVRQQSHRLLPGRRCQYRNWAFGLFKESRNYPKRGRIPDSGSGLEVEGRRATVVIPANLTAYTAAHPTLMYR